MASARERGLVWDYPKIAADGIDLLLITHEHADHNAVERIAGEPATLRSTAGTRSSPIGEVVGIASEHDEAAGTERGPQHDLRLRSRRRPRRPPRRPRAAGSAHYRTPRIGFLETEEEFVAAMPETTRLDSPSFDTADLEHGSAPLVVIPAAP